ncbi:unnamed protein product [Brachionus calyciflorus]|uniref:Signal peptidase complex subunit 1 n=1 Tax=Brachionus calyciflorus TaxID=104777 RepID=A0A813TP92_9BILA|nr:unnamed protein product [Brachionus calyciflorus]
MVFDSISTSIDFVGQRRAERLFQVIVSVFAVIGFVYGFIVQKFSFTLIILAVGVGLSALAVLPPWPFWKRNQLKWQKVVKVENKQN